MARHQGVAVRRTSPTLFMQRHPCRGFTEPSRIEQRCYDSVPDSTPQTGVDSILATYSLLGPVFALFRPVAAFVSGLIGGGSWTCLKKISWPPVQLRNATTNAVHPTGDEHPVASDVPTLLWFFRVTSEGPWLSAWSLLE